MDTILERNEADELTEAEHQALHGLTSPPQANPQQQEPEFPMMTRVERYKRRKKPWWQKFFSRRSLI